MSQRIIPLRDLDEERALFGSLDRNIHLLRRLYHVDAVSRGGVVRLSGEPAAIEEAGLIVEQALDCIRNGRGGDGAEIERIIRRSSDELRTHGSGQGGGHGNGHGNAHGGHAYGHGQGIPNGNGNETAHATIQPRTENQARYLAAIRENTVTFGIGPAGTGKSFLAVAAAVSFLKEGVFRRVVLCRPAVEAGESLGFLPGDLAAKINPYLRPLYDALNEMLPRGQLKRYIEEDVVEILPLAYMRGRTLDHAVIILDEAQNCTHTQMKMALTRLGNDSKMIVTGDITQIDLPSNKSSGLLTARRILQGIEGVEFVHLNKADIVRHPVVAAIVRAYGKDDESERGGALVRLAGIDDPGERPAPKKPGPPDGPKGGEARSPRGAKP